LISGRPQRRRRALAWSTLASAVVHIIFLTLLFYAVAHLFIPRGAKERITQTNTIKIEHEVASTPQPTPKPKHVAHIVAQHESAPARTPRRELAKIVQVRAPALPPPHRPTIESKIERDRSGFAKEVAQLNAQNDVHAIPTIDPGSQESASKTYAFEPPASMRGDPHGNGIITPTRDWHDSGRDCYYGRYEFTYPDGAMESGTIVWPFCYDPDDDPFKLPPHSIPFPLPLPGFRLTSVDELPPIEKSVYEQWISGRSGP
jgi:hypothetical protein